MASYLERRSIFKQYHTSGKYGAMFPIFLVIRNYLFCIWKILYGIMKNANKFPEDFERYLYVF